MAYFRKKGKGWQYTVEIGIDPVTGERKQKSKGGFKTKKDAQLAAADLEQQLAIGMHVKENNMTFEEFGREWLRMYEHTGKVKVSTVRVRNHEFNRLLPYFAKLKLSSITKKRYQEALDDLHAKGFAYNTLCGINSTGRMIFSKAIEQDVLKVDPTTFAYVPKPSKSVEEIEAEKENVKYLEKEELAAFLKQAKNSSVFNDYISFLILSYTGMRIGEMASLKWKDIDLVEGTINITKTYYNPNNNTLDYRLLTPKTPTSKRKIEIDEFVVTELEKHKLKQNEFKMKNRKTYKDLDFVIANVNSYQGYPIILKATLLRMQSLLRAAGLNDSLTPHSLRHTHTSLLAEAGVELQEIMDRLGHKDDYTTRNVYLHVTKAKKKEASQKFRELMRGL